MAARRAVFQPPGRRRKNRAATCRKTEVIQSYLRIWGTYDPIVSGPSELKKWGFLSCGEKKAEFQAKMRFFAQNSFFFRNHDQTTKRQNFCADPVAKQASGRHWLAIKLISKYIHLSNVGRDCRLGFKVRFPFEEENPSNWQSAVSQT